MSLGLFASAPAAGVLSGLMANPTVRIALLAGAVVGCACAVVGVFTVIRGQAFAGHALSDIAAAGGSAAFLFGFAPLAGFVGVALAGAAGMEAIGVRRVRGRDVATGVVLGAGLGVAALLLYLDTTVANTTGAVISVLFGSLFTIAWGTLGWVAIAAALCIAVMAGLYRPLLLASVHPDLAAARGVPVRAVGLAFLLTLAVAVALSALSVGAILSTALLIGPAATALRITTRPATAIAAAAGIGVGATWAGVVLAYASFSWPPRHQGWPVSFFIVTLILVGYLLADGLSHRYWRRREPSPLRLPVSAGAVGGSNSAGGAQRAGEG